MHECLDDPLNGMSAAILHSPSVPTPRPVLPLSSSTRSLLRSAPLLFSLPQCIAELVENALDAAASHIHIVVDCGRLSFSVADDGRGMDRQELERCGVRHWTTKSKARGERGQCVFGARGEALASLADIATVDITTTASRHSSRQRHAHSAAASSSSSSPSSSRRISASTYHKRLSASSTAAVTSLSFSSPQSHGTTVAVSHLYSNLPVRRRLLLSRRDRERESIKRRIERISLVHRHVVFTVWDDEHRRQLLSKGRLTDLPSSFGELYRYDLAASFLPMMSLDEASVGLRLYVSSLTAGYHTRDYQFVYINRRPVVQPTLRRLINQCWQRCRLFMDGGPTPNMRVLHAVFVLLLEMDDDCYDCLLQSDKQLVVMTDEDAVIDAVRRCLHAGLISRYPVLQQKASELFGDVESDERLVGERVAEEEERKGGSEKENDSCVGNGAFIDLTGDVTVHLPSRCYSHLGDSCRVRPTFRSVEAAVPYSQARRSFSSFNHSNDRTAQPHASHSPSSAVPSAPASSVLTRPPPQSSPAIHVLEEEELLLDEPLIQSNEGANSRTLQESKADVEAGSSMEETRPSDETLCSPGEIEAEDVEVGGSFFPVFLERNSANGQTIQGRSSKRRKADVAVTSLRIEQPIDLTVAEGAVRCEKGAASSNEGSFLPTAHTLSSAASLSAQGRESRPVPAHRPPVRSLQSAFDEGEHKSTGDTGNAAMPAFVGAEPAARPVAFNPSTERLLSSQADCLTPHSSAAPFFRSSSPSQPSVLSLQKRMLQHARIVGQADHMYVLCLLDERHLVAVDQHAADERVRLEDLEAHIAQLVGSQPLAQPLQCQLTSIEVGTLQLYRQQLDRWGWRLVQDGEQTPNTYTVTHCPALLLPPVACLDSVAALHDYLAQLSHSLRSPSPPQLPQSLLALLHSRACKSAIRFGDRLSTPQQVGLVRALSRCQLPFQCAHGRPSMQPLADVSDRDERKQQQQQAEVGEGDGTLPKWWKERMRKQLGRLTAVREKHDTRGESAAQARLMV